MSLRIAVMVSGNGSNLQALIDHIESDSLDVQIVAVISDKANAYAIKRAEEAGLPTFVVTASRGEPREAYDQRIANILIELNVDLVVLAGFMRILSPHFVQGFQGKIINIHPSLLPKYRGLDTHQRALDAGDKEHGVSIHFVSEELDGGPIIAQTKIPIKKSDSAESLKKRIQKQEHRLYPQVVSWFALKRLHLKGDRVYLDDVPLPAQGLHVTF